MMLASQPTLVVWNWLFSCNNVPLCIIHLGPAKSKAVEITYVEPNGDERVVQAEVGKNLLDIAHDNNIELEGAFHGGVNPQE